MHNSKYMFVKYNKNFPVYVSRQNNRENLVIPHFHEDVEILKITKGNVVIQAGNRFLECHQGDILFFAPNTLHQVNSVDKNAEIIAISYSDRILKFAIDYTLKKVGFHSFSNADQSYLKINQIFKKAIDIFNEKSIAYEVEMTACLLELSALLIKEKMAVVKAENSGKSRLEPAIKYIEENLDSPIKIADLIKVLNLSKEHIIRLFKDEIGKTPAEYITDRKIKKAMSMLVETTVSLTEISESLGFSNPSHFSKVFKERIKMTPTKYRNRA